MTVLDELEHDIERHRPGLISTFELRHQRAVVLQYQRRYPEALALFRELLPEARPARSPQSLLLNLDIAETLSKLGDHQGAVRYLERLLRGTYSQESAAGIAWVLEGIARLSRKPESPITSPRVGYYLRKLRDWWEVPLRLDRNAVDEDPVRHILRLKRICNQANGRYNTLFWRLARNGADPRKRKGLIRELEEYVQAEPVGSYRKLAEAELLALRNRQN